MRPGSRLISTFAVCCAATLPGQNAAAPEAEKPLLPYLVQARVMDTTGRPINGAGLAVFHGSDTPLDTALTRTKPVARSDADGRLAVTVPRERGKSTVLLLSAKGKICLRLSPHTVKHKVGGVEVLKADFGNIVLNDGVDISGLIRSRDGEPLSGAEVVASGVLARMLASRYNNRTNLQRVTYGVANEKGIVHLYGVPKYGASVQVTAKGYYPTHIPYLNRHVPLVATMEKGGEIVGQVVGPDGKPIKDVYIHPYSEFIATQGYSAPGRRIERSKAGGMFRMAVPGPGRYRLYFYGKVDGSQRYVYRWSKVYRGPQSGLILELTDEPTDEPTDVAAAALAKKAAKPQPNSLPNSKPKPRSATKKLIVKITDKKTGIAVRAAKAAVLWWAPQNWQHNSGYLERQGRSAQERKTDEQGRLELAKPGSGQPATGRVIIIAKGYAPLIIKDVEWDEDARENLIAAELEPESSLAGFVKDERGRPVAGVKVFAIDDLLALRNYVPAPMRRRFDSRTAVVVTDEKGAFKITNLAKGKLHVYLSHPTHADADPIEIELAPGEARQDIELELRKGGSLIGKLVGCEPRPGWQVQIMRMAPPTRNFRSYSGLNTDQASEFVSVNSDGSFRIEGLSRANYNLFLSMQGGTDTIRIPIEPIRMRSKDLVREFDISEDLPGRLQGRVTIQGAPLPPGRVLLLARSVDQQVQSYYSGRPNLVGHPVVVESDGQFALDLPEGSYVLQLIDLATAVELYRGVKSVLVKPTKTTQTSFTVDLASVTVKLIPEEEGKEILASRIEIQVTHPAMPNQNRNRVFGGSQDSGVGLRLKPGATEVQLVLPCVPTKLLARSDAHNLDPKLNSYNFAAIGEVELTPKTAKSNRVEIKVSEPEVDVTNQRR